MACLQYLIMRLKKVCNLDDDGIEIIDLVMLLGYD